MAIPAAPQEFGGAKILFLTYDASGTNTPAVHRGVAPRTVNGTALAYEGIATHADGDTWVSADPVVAIAGYDSVGTAIRKLLADTTGRLIPRPQGAYDGGSVNAFGHPSLVSHVTVHGEEVGWLGFATHARNATAIGASDGVVVQAGIDGSANVKGRLVDSLGRGIMDMGYVFGGTRTFSSTSTSIQAGPAVAARKAKIRAVSTGTTYVGVSGVTADANASTGGWQLAQNETLDIDGITNLNQIFVIGASARTITLLYWT